LITPERTIEGTCFRSDENMNHYTVTNSKGSFVNSDIEGDKNNEPQPASATNDTTTTQPQIRPASQKRKASGK
jgi:hypothetical protein